MILPLKTLPAEILRTPGREIGDPNSSAIKKLIADMYDTVRHANGIGLAAQQIGKDLCLAVINLEHLEIPIFALINPKVTKVSKKTDDMEEGCLSVPGVYGIVERPEKIEFTAIDHAGRTIKGECGGLLAKVIQHEVDHMSGILIIDKIKKYVKGKNLVK